MITKPKICAEFRMSDGEPVVAFEDGDVRHYAVRLYIEGAPADARVVTYHLHDTFYDPLREVRRTQADFSENIETYGDFQVIATIRGPDGTSRITRGLAAALKEQYGDDAPDVVKNAIRDIAEN